jgi:hypothetical protein
VRQLRVAGHHFTAGARKTSECHQEEGGQPELGDFCLLEHVLKKRELIGLLLSRAGREPRLQALGCR